MKIYIVYEGEFCTNKPREHMAKPHILLVTTNKGKALFFIEEKYKDYQQYEWVEQLDRFDESFQFNNEYDTYGQVGIIEHDLE